MFICGEPQHRGYHVHKQLAYLIEIFIWERRWPRRLAVCSHESFGNCSNLNARELGALIQQVLYGKRVEQLGLLVI